MCGFSGIVRKDGQPLTVDQLEKFNACSDLMNHRGPDHKGTYVDDSVCLIHYRLAVIDLDSRSNQPFVSKDQNHAMAYNGEVYNYKEIAEEEQLQLETESDTEVLFKTFINKGLNVVIDWNGIFALAVWDKKANKISLLRDRFGTKPLYYADCDGFFMFASEAKVIYAWMDTLVVDNKALAEYFFQGNPMGEDCLIQGVKKLAPASCLNYCTKFNTKSISTYWKNPGTKIDTKNLNDIKTETAMLLESAVRRQLVADVPLGIFLSGGIDSSALTAFASRNSDKKIETYSVEFDYNPRGQSELKQAALVAGKFGTNHHELLVESKGLASLIEELVFQHDDPFADAANIPLYLLTKKIKNEITVVLQGDGGDEFFGGYGRYQLLNQQLKYRFLSGVASIIHPKSTQRQRTNRIYRALSHKVVYKKLAALASGGLLDNNQFNYLCDNWATSLKAEDVLSKYKEVHKKYIDEDILQQMIYTDVEIELPNTFLDKVDKSTMLNSIEARVPFLDSDLADFSLALPSKYKVHKKEKKFLLRESLRGIVPNEILDAPKRGFGVPVDSWLRNDLKELMLSKIYSPIAVQLFHKPALDKLCSEHFSNSANHGYQLWKFMILAIWMEKYESKLVFK